MSYIAIKGGESAIDAAADVMDLLRTRGAAEGETPLELPAIEHQLHFLHSQIISEGGLYDPQLAALAVKQCLGDPLEAAFMLRAYRCTRPRLGDLPPIDTAKMRLIRRISSAFKDIPGGQMLGPTADYSQRLFRLELMEETPEEFRAALEKWQQATGSADAAPTEIPKVLDFLRNQGLVDPLPPPRDQAFDITRQPLVFPCSRSAALATMTRSHQGSLLGIAYSSMNGYGDIHPTIAELRVGYVPVEVPHPATGEPLEIGEVLITECEVVAMFDEGETEENTRGIATGLGLGRMFDKPPRFSLGYGACFGHNEFKAICMAILDRTLQKGLRDGPQHPAEDQEFVLLHADGIDSMGFTLHWKMPHYVTFLSKLDKLRETQKKRAAKYTAASASENGLPAEGNGHPPGSQIGEHADASGASARDFTGATP